MCERLKEIRKSLGLNQTDFGGRLGVTPTAISILESGKRNLTEQMLLAICREYSVNEEWIRTGNGDMFVHNENEEIARLADEYNLDALSYKIMESYLRLGEEQQRVIRRFIAETAEQDAAPATYENELQHAQKDLSAKEQADLLRARADAIEKGSAESTIIERDA